MATDYHEELCHWLNKDYSSKKGCVMQLPFTPPAGGQTTGVKDEEKERLRREKQGRRLQEINCKKLQEKVR
jgi:actin-related protein 5